MREHPSHPFVWGCLILRHTLHTSLAYSALPDFTRKPVSPPSPFLARSVHTCMPPAGLRAAHSSLLCWGLAHRQAVRMPALCCLPCPYLAVCLCAYEWGVSRLVYVCVCVSIKDARCRVYQVHVAAHAACVLRRCTAGGPARHRQDAAGKGSCRRGARQGSNVRVQVRADR